MLLCLAKLQQIQEEKLCDCPGWNSSLIFAEEREVDPRLECSLSGSSSGWQIRCWGGSFAMQACISLSFCGTRMQDISIEIVKNRWPLGRDTIKQHSGLGTIAEAVRGLTATVINDIFYFHSRERVSDRSIINEQRGSGQGGKWQFISKKTDLKVPLKQKLWTQWKMETIWPKDPQTENAQCTKNLCIVIIFPAISFGGPLHSEPSVGQVDEKRFFFQPS